MANEPPPLLLRGDYGVGKHVLANLIHQWGPHPEGPCIFVRSESASPASAPHEVLQRIGQSEFRGTLVFEEISEFTLAQQGELLELITAKDSGDNSDDALLAGVKIVVTNSWDLSTSAKKGKFHQELLSLLMDDTLYLPSLRERPEDIACLAEQMLAHFSQLHHRPGMSLQPEAKLALARHPWPGNVHELRNSIERVVLSAKKPEIEESDFRLRPVSDSGCNSSGNFLSLDAMEKQHILRVMRAYPTLEEAAQILQVDISTLWRKRHRYGV